MIKIDDFVDLALAIELAQYAGLRRGLEINRCIRCIFVPAIKGSPAEVVEEDGVPDSKELAKIYVKAQAEGTDDSIAVLEPHLADDVLLTMALGPVDGKEAVLKQMRNPVTMRNFTIGRWGEPAEDGDSVKMTSSMPIEATLGGFNLTFNYTSDGKLHRILMQPIPAPPMPVSELKLTDEIKQIVKEAPGKASQLLLAAIDPNGQVKISLRGSTTVFSDTQLCFWARNLEGSTEHGIQKNPRVAFWYREGPTQLQFYGDAHIESDEATRQKVYGQAPGNEQRADAQMKGGPVIIDLQTVQGALPSGRVNMRRGG
jgi:hypothetical protein